MLLQLNQAITWEASARQKPSLPMPHGLEANVPWHARKTISQKAADRTVPLETMIDEAHESVL